jgi:hypothetical protein
MPPCCRRRRPRPRLVHGGGGAAVAWPAGLTWGGPDAESRAGGRRSCRAAGAVDHAQAVANGCCEYTYQHVCVAFAQRGRGAVEPPGKRLEARSPPQRPARTPECSTRLCAPAPRRRAGANLHVAGIPTRGEGRSAPARRGEELPRSALRHCAAPPAGIDALKRQRGCPGRAGEFRCAPPCADIRIAVRRGEKRPRAARGRASAVCAAPLRRATRRDRRAGANLHAACIPTRPHATPSPFRVDLERGGLARGGLQLPPRGEGRGAPAQTFELRLPQALVSLITTARATVAALRSEHTGFSF